MIPMRLLLTTFLTRRRCSHCKSTTSFTYSRRTLLESGKVSQKVSMESSLHLMFAHSSRSEIQCSTRPELVSRLAPLSPPLHPLSRPLRSLLLLQRLLHLLQRSLLLPLVDPLLLDPPKLAAVSLPSNPSLLPLLVAVALLPKLADSLLNNLLQPLLAAALLSNLFLPRAVLPSNLFLPLAPLPSSPLALEVPPKLVASHPSSPLLLEALLPRLPHPRPASLHLVSRRLA